MGRAVPIFSLLLVQNSKAFLFSLLVIHQAGCWKPFCSPEGGANAPVCGFPLCPQTLLCFSESTVTTRPALSAATTSMPKDLAAEPGEVWVQHSVEGAPPNLAGELLGSGTPRGYTWTSCRSPETVSRDCSPLCLLKFLSAFLPFCFLPAGMEVTLGVLQKRDRLLQLRPAELGKTSSVTEGLFPFCDNMFPGFFRFFVQCFCFCICRSNTYSNLCQFPSEAQSV